MLRTLFFANVNNVDTAGLINLAFNIPLFLLALKKMKKRMVVGTVLSVALQTIIFTYIIAPTAPILDDKLACIVIAGLLGGVGCGLILTNSASAGGLDLLGLYLSHKSKKISVGIFNIIYNIILYTLMAILFDVSTSLYSIIYIVVFSVTIDHWHYQNIEVELMIFTHVPEVKQMIMHEYARGVLVGMVKVHIPIITQKYSSQLSQKVRYLPSKERFENLIQMPRNRTYTCICVWRLPKATRIALKMR